MSDIIITGRNADGEIVRETIPGDVLNSPFVRELSYITQERFATLGIDLDAELHRTQTLNEAMEELQIAIGRLMHAFLLDVLKFLFLPVRFFLWLNGDK